MRDMKAVGRRCTKAVAMSTPVPKCLLRKRNWCGTGNFGKRLAMMGNEHAGDESDWSGQAEGMCQCQRTGCAYEKY